MRAKILTTVAAGAVSLGLLSAPAFAAGKNANPGQGHKAHPCQQPPSGSTSPGNSGSAPSSTASTPASTAPGQGNGSGACGQVIQKLVEKANDQLNKINAAISRGTTAEPKISTILSMLQSRGVDVSAATATFNDFESQLSAAQQAVAGVPGLLSQVSLTDPSADKGIAQQVHSAFQSAHGDLKAALGDVTTLRSDWQSIRGTLGAGAGSGSGSTSQPPAGGGGAGGSTSGASGAAVQGA